MPRQRQEPKPPLTEEQILKGLNNGLRNLYPQGNVYRERRRNHSWVMNKDKRSAAIKAFESVAPNKKLLFSTLFEKAKISYNGLTESVNYLTRKPYGQGGREILHRLLLAIDEIEQLPQEEREPFLKRNLEWE